MTWARFDDNTLDWPPLVSVSPYAQLLYYRARIYFSKHNTKGVIPKGALAVLGSGLSRPSILVTELISVGLFAVIPEGWLIVGWERWVRPERDETERKAAQRLGGKRSVEVRRELFGSAQPQYKPTKSPEVNLEVITSELTSKLIQAPRDGTGRVLGRKTPRQRYGVPAPQDREPLGTGSSLDRPGVGNLPPTDEEIAAFQDGDFVEDDER